MALRRFLARNSGNRNCFETDRERGLECYGRHSMSLSRKRAVPEIRGGAWILDRNRLASQGLFILVRVGIRMPPLHSRTPNDDLPLTLAGSMAIPEGR